MAIKTIIADGIGNNGSAAVVTREDYPEGLMTYTKEYENSFGQILPFFNPSFGFDLNQNGEFSGTPDGIHNGTDSALWTASAISGTWDFASSTQAQAGTKSIDGTSTKNNNEALFTRASTISTGSYTALSGWIYITAWPTTGVRDLELRIRNGGTDVGTAVPLAQFIETASFNRWQKFAIPLTEFTEVAETIDELVIRVISSGGSGNPDFYLDNIQWEESGAPVTFQIDPPESSIYKVFNLTTFAAANVSSTLADASHQNVSFDKFFGLTKLTIGMTSTTTSNGVFTFSGIFQQHADFAMIPRTNFTSGGDGTNTWYRFDTKFDKPIRLDSRVGDNLQFIVNDDLSSLQFFRIFANGTTEPLIRGENS